MRRFAAACLTAAALLLGAAAPAPPPVDLARLLSDAPAPTLDAYRLFLDAGGRSPNAGLTPYALNTPLFSDYSTKHRLVYLPPNTRARYTPTGVFDFPVGATLVKTFAYPADLRDPGKAERSVETRLLIRRPAGWTALTYVWNAEQTRATLKRGGARIPISFTGLKGEPVSFSYAVPNVNQCKECHALDETLTLIGPKARNLNGDFAYPEGAENQLARWTRLGLLEGAPAPAAAPVTVRWDDLAAPLDGRARAYLDANCGHCHNPAAIANNSGLFLNAENADPVALGVGKRPVAAGRGAGNLDYDIAPGDPDGSILVHRMVSTEPGVMMPEISRNLVHAEGVTLMREWIAAMKPAPAPAG